ncbi:unnamed protein product [Paramecium sonneborni]|uniref:Uncharacterized protein n=1 Tax=Paramecium sonneborni TaxID=65129 RepID=A0A8S1LES7_9CILI|nr:unnamed protein product [Paramecium sonneborni]
MQQQQQIYEQYDALCFGEEQEEHLKNLIHLLKTKRRKPKPQIIQKDDEEGYQFDTLKEVKENGSHLSNLSSDTHQTFISINITDYEARQLQKMLEDLFKEFKQQQCEKERYKKAYSELYQNSQSGIKEIQKKISNSDVVQNNKKIESQDIKYSTDNSNKTSKKVLNPNQIVQSLRKLNTTYQKYLDEIRKSKQHNHSDQAFNQLRQKVEKFQEQQQNMKKDILILQECRTILNENEKILLEHDQELIGINQIFQR